MTMLCVANSFRTGKPKIRIRSRFVSLWRHNRPGAGMQPQPGAKASKRESEPWPRLRLAAIAPALSCELIHQSDLERLAGWIAPLRALELKASAVEQTQRRGFAGIHERGDSFDLVRLEGMREQRLKLIVDGLRKPHRL